MPSNGVAPPPASQATRFRVTVTDNGPGIVRQQIPPIFAKLLYGSKFHRLRMSRGQQGIGISAAGMYGQLTTGKPVQIISRTGATLAGPLLRSADRHQEERAADLESKKIEWEHPARHPGRDRDRGPVPEGPRLGGRVPGADRDREPAREARLSHAGRGDARVSRARSTSCRRRRRRSSRIPTASSSACCSRCCRTRRATRSPASWRATSAASPPPSAEEICKTAKLSPTPSRANVHGEEAEALYKAIQTTKIMAPPTNCLSPIGEKAILPGLYKQIKGEFYTAVTRPPAVYRGNPFVIEAGLAFGKGPDQAAPTAADSAAVPLAEGEDRRGRRRARARDPLRQPRAAALPAVGLRDLQGGARDRLAELRHDPVARRAPRRADGDLRPHGLGVGAVHQRVQGSDRRLRRDPEGDPLALQECGRRLGVFLRRARAGQERVPAPQHLRALHRGGRRGLQPPEGRQARRSSG